MLSRRGVPRAGPPNFGPGRCFRHVTLPLPELPVYCFATRERSHAPAGFILGGVHLMNRSERDPARHHSFWRKGLAKVAVAASTVLLVVFGAAGPAAAAADYTQSVTQL